jgi:hypothetical protein
MRSYSKNDPQADGRFIQRYNRQFGLVEPIG